VIAFWKKVLEEDSEYWENARIILALVFIPPSHFEQAMQALKRKLKPVSHPAYAAVFNWLEKCVVGTLRPGGGRTPVYNQDLWQMHNRIFPELPRTNNVSENWHKSLNKRIRGKHPEISLFIENLKHMIRAHDVQLQQMEQGVPAKPNKRRAKISTQLLVLATRMGFVDDNPDFDSNSNSALLNYLKNVARTFDMMAKVEMHKKREDELKKILESQ
jgi:hypothetical protein